MESLKLSPPWAIYYRQLKTFFSDDPEVRVLFDEDAHKIRLYVNGDAKSAALASLLPSSKTFGNVEVQIEVVPADAGSRDIGGASLFDQVFAAMDTNEAVQNILITADASDMDIMFVIFKPRVAQYFNDDMFSYYGCRTTTYEDLARGLFPDLYGKVFFCTGLAQDSGVLLSRYTK